ncbi:protein HGH1 homolog isoform X1 [Lampetra fluviatilis]
MEPDQVKDLLGFLQQQTRPDLKSQVTEYLLGLTSSAEGRTMLAKEKAIIEALNTLIKDPSLSIVSDYFNILINLSADESVSDVFMTNIPVSLLLSNMLKPKYHFSEQICAILSNLTRDERVCKHVLDIINANDTGLTGILDLFFNEGLNKNGKLHYLGPLMSNLSQIQEVRRFLLDRDRDAIQRFLPYTQYEASSVRRGGVVGTLRNCCFDHEHHEWLLGEHVDILPFLLLPLAGPEELDEKDMEGLPIDLQYLPEDKQRENDPDIRRMLIDAIMLLAATSKGRQVLKEKNAYVILRELHKWEEDLQARTACENLLQVLIGDEPESSMQNLLKVQIPPHVEQQLLRQDEDQQLTD